MKKINDYLGKSGGHDNPGCYWKILAIQEGTGKRYPSIKNGVELHWDDPEYWKYKVVTVYKAYYLTVAGNPVACESFLRKEGFKALAINPTTVEIRVETTEINEIMNN
ncbi:MAG: hypothetical protein WBJ22_01450 [Minisyncoccales bacterium]